MQNFVENHFSNLWPNWAQVFGDVKRLSNNPPVGKCDENTGKWAADYPGAASLRLCHGCGRVFYDAFTWAHLSRRTIPSPPSTVSTGYIFAL